MRFDDSIGTSSQNVYDRIDILPDEIWASIFHFLPLESIPVIARTCRHFHELTDEDIFWRPFARQFGFLPRDEMQDGNWKQAVINSKA